MNNLLENNLQKHYRIIYFLLYKEWVKIKDISQQTGVSERTIRQQIGDINQYIHPAKIESSSHFGIRLLLKSDQNAFYLFSALYKQSIRFTILEELFFHKHQNLSELSDKLFLSVSTLKRKIQELNENLNSYHLFIDSNHLDICGDERRLCWFFYCYLIEKYGILDQLVCNEEISLLDEMIDEFFAFYPALKTPQRSVYSYLNKFRTMLYINIIQIKKGHLSCIDSQQANDILFSFSKPLTEKVRNYYQIKLSKMEHYRLFYIFFNNKYAWNIEDLEMKASQNNDLLDIKLAIEEILDTLAYKEHLKLSNRSYVLIYLYNATTYIWGPTKILYNPNEEFFTSLNNYYEKFTNQIHDIILDIFSQKDLPIFVDESVVNQFMFMLITSWESLPSQLEEKAPTIRVGLFLNTSYEHCKFLQQDITYHLNPRLNIEIIQSTSLNTLRENCGNYDLLLTNISTLSLLKCEVVSIHSNPTPKDFENILLAYNRIVNNKAFCDLATIQKHNSIYKF